MAAANLDAAYGTQAGPVGLGGDGGVAKFGGGISSQGRCGVGHGLQRLWHLAGIVAGLQGFGGLDGVNQADGETDRDQGPLAGRVVKGACGGAGPC